MIAGQLERDIHRLNGVVGNGDFRQIGLDGGKAQRGGLLQQAAVHQQKPGDLSDLLLHPRQAGKRMAEARGHPPRQPPHQPVVSGAGDAVIDRRQQRRLPVGEQAQRFRLGSGWRIDRPDIHRVLCRHPHVAKNHLMAAGGPHPGVIPAFHHANPGAVARHQPGAHPRRVIIASRPYRQPA